MRPALRLLATVKPARFLEPNAPTGLTGLFTHPAPRSTLIYLYSTTLERLRQMPESSVYRQSTEALTRQRLGVVEAIKPAGYDSWRERANKQIADNPHVFNSSDKGKFKDGATYVKVERDGKTFINTQLKTDTDDRTEEWNGEEDEGGEREGASFTDKDQKRKVVTRPIPEAETPQITWEPEPPLDESQISEIETKIGAGLIEEVIAVAEGELKLADLMNEKKAWEELEEKPAEGQWKAFERDTNTGGTQAP